MIEKVMVFFIVAAAVGFALRSLYRTVFGKESRCRDCASACSCDSKPVNIQDGC